MRTETILVSSYSMPTKSAYLNLESGNMNQLCHPLIKVNKASYRSQGLNGTIPLGELRCDEIHAREVKKFQIHHKESATSHYKNRKQT